MIKKIIAVLSVLFLLSSCSFNKGGSVDESISGLILIDTVMSGYNVEISLQSPALIKGDTNNVSIKIQNINSSLY